MKSVKQIIAEAVDATFMQRGFNASRHADAVIAALEREELIIVPIKPNERMLEELARIGDGPDISGEECWGYMLAASMAEPEPHSSDKGTP